MTVKLYCNVEKLPEGYQGYLTAYIGKAQLWVKRSGIIRLDVVQADNDAKTMKTDCLAVNMV